MSEKPRKERPVRPRKMEKALSAAYRKTPGPSTLAALMEHCLRYNNFGRARKLLDEGLEKYPDSRKMRVLEQRMKRTDFYGEFLKANREITDEPNPDSYARLAMLYRAVGDADKALETCAAGLAAFPDSVRLYLNVAELRLHRYARDFMPKDAFIALANLEKAVSLDDTDYAATILLAEFYMAIGAADSAINTLKKMLVSHPEDEHAQKLLESALEMSRTSEPMEDLLKEVSESRRMAVGPDILRYLEKCMQAGQGETARRTIDTEKMNEALALAVETTGARAMAILNPEGAVAASARQEGDPIDAEALAAAAAEIHDNTNDYALRMDLGSFENGEIEGPFGHLLVNSVQGWMVAGLTAPKPSNRERMRKRMQEVAEDCILTAPAEESGPPAEDTQPEQGA